MCYLQHFFYFMCFIIVKSIIFYSLFCLDVFLSFCLLSSQPPEEGEESPLQAGKDCLMHEMLHVTHVNMWPTLTHTSFHLCCHKGSTHFWIIGPSTVIHRWKNASCKDQISQFNTQGKTYRAILHTLSMVIVITTHEAIKCNPGNETVFIFSH